MSPGFEPRYDHVTRPVSGFRSGAARGDIRRLGPPKSEILLPGERTRAVGTRRGRDCIGVSARANAFGRVSGGWISGPSCVRVSVRRVTRCAVTSDPSLREPGGKSEEWWTRQPDRGVAIFSGCLLAFRRRFHTASQSEKKCKIASSRCPHPKSERKSERRKSARLPRGWIGGGWTRSRASDVGRSGNVFCDINYKASVAGGALGAASARRRPCALAAVFPSAPANWRRFVHPSRNVSPFPLFFSSQIPSRSSFLFSSQRRSASGARVVAPPDLRPPRCLGVPAVQSFSSSAVSSRIPS